MPFVGARGDIVNQAWASESHCCFIFLLGFTQTEPIPKHHSMFHQTFQVPKMEESSYSMDFRLCNGVSAPPKIAKHKP